MHLSILSLVLASYGSVDTPTLPSVPAQRVRSMWIKPDPSEQMRRDRALAGRHRTFDPAESMIKISVTNPGYHINLKTGSLGHPTKGSLDYALDLLDTGLPEHVNRAAAIIRKVLSLQDTNPESKTYGIWSWYLEEPLEKMKAPDFNWADFCSTTLLQIVRDHRDRLPKELLSQIESSIVHSLRCIKRRNVGPSYTNIAIVGAYATLVGGEILNLPEFVIYGRDRLRAFYTYTLQNGAFEEYNSPSYTLLALKELTRIKAGTTDPEALKIIDPLIRVAWEEIARHFHPTTRQWAGPQSRSYDSILKGSLLQDVQRATEGRVNFGIKLAPETDNRIPLRCPQDLEGLFRQTVEPRTVKETFIKRLNRVGTTYIHPKFALGSVNQEDMWNQRRTVLLYFGDQKAPGYMHLRFLKDDYDFSSAWLNSIQQDGMVVGAVNFVTNGGDTHISLDMVKGGKIKAKDLRLRFEFGGLAAANIQFNILEDREVAISGAEIPISISVPKACFGSLVGKLQAGGNEKVKWLDVAFYSGEAKEFDLKRLDEAVTGFVFSVGKHGAVSSKQVGETFELSCDGISLSTRTKPGLKPSGPVAASSKHAK